MTGSTHTHAHDAIMLRGKGSQDGKPWCSEECVPIIDMGLDAGLYLDSSCNTVRATSAQVKPTRPKRA